MAVTSAQVQELYVGLLGRAADKAGLDYWLGQLNATGSTLTLENLRANFVNEQAEYAATYGNLARADLVKAIYTNLFERTPTTEEVNYWANGSVSADQMVVAFLNGASAADKQVVGNKVFVAEAYSTSTGSNYNAAAAKAVVADVNGTVASVNAALATLESGGLAGQVPALAQLKAVQAAEAAKVAYGTELFKANAAMKAADVGGDANGVVSTTEATGVLTTAQGVRTAISGDSTAVIQAKVASSTTVVEAARTGLTAAEKTSATAYETAVAAKAAAAAAVSAANYSVEKGAAIGGLDADAAFQALNGTTAGGVTIGTAAALMTGYAGATAAERAQIDTALKDVGAYAAFKAVAVKEAAVTDTTAAVTSTGAVLSGGSSAAQAFKTAADDKAGLETTLKSAQAEDVKVAAVKAIVDQLTQLDKVATDAGTALTKAVADSGAVLDEATGGFAVTANKADVLYFGAPATGANDLVVAAGFAKGDFLVLGDGYTFNSGALTTGNNNALEVFFIQNGANAQVVVEAKAFGSSNGATVDASGVITQAADDQLAVITLTGVNAADLNFSNGVVSFV
jgi:hypothetical protein